MGSVSGDPTPSISLSISLSIVLSILSLSRRDIYICMWCVYFYIIKGIARSRRANTYKLFFFI
jgi:hypothetical protein